jgi:hypothetical protein
MGDRRQTRCADVDVGEQTTLPAAYTLGLDATEPLWKVWDSARHVGIAEITGTHPASAPAHRITFNDDLSVEVTRAETAYADRAPAGSGSSPAPRKAARPATPVRHRPLRRGGRATSSRRSPGLRRAMPAGRPASYGRSRSRMLRTNPARSLRFMLPGCRRSGTGVARCRRRSARARPGSGPATRRRGRR